MFRKSKNSRGSAWRLGLSCRVGRSGIAVGVLALTVAGVLGGPLLATGIAGEADDLQAMIDRARNGVRDLERLDEKAAARPDIDLLRTWLNEAWTLRSEQKYDDVRVVLDRCDAQAEMIRQTTLAAKGLAQAAEKEAKVAKLRAEIETTRKAIEEARVQKAALEGRSTR